VNKTWLVFRREVTYMLSRRSFQLTAFGIPLISMGIFLVVGLVNRSAPTMLTELQIVPTIENSQVEGYVDKSGLIQFFPEGEESTSLIAFPDEDAAESAMQAGDISAYYIIPANYIATGEIIYVQPSFNPLRELRHNSQIHHLLQFNLLRGNSQLDNLLETPFKLNTIVLEPTQQTDRSNPWTIFLPYSVMFMYYILILMSASFLVTSLAKERENYLLEIIMVSVSPNQLLAGKIIGLGLIGLLINFLWVGTGLLLLRLGGGRLSLPQEFQLSGSLLVWGILFFLLGYLIYASLMSALGVMLPNMREISQATFILLIPMLIPIMFVGSLVEQPNGWLAVVFSLFPFTSPVAMMMRLTVTQVPLWQIVLSLLLLVGASVLTVRAVAGIFRAQTMFAGSSKPWRYLLFQLFGLNAKSPG
jgi:ABC-2 type transport system permease protein